MQPRFVVKTKKQPIQKPEAGSPSDRSRKAPIETETVILEPHWAALVDGATD